MSTAIEGFGKQILPATSYSQPLSLNAQMPAGPPPLQSDSFTASQAAGVLTSAGSQVSSVPTPVQEFEQSQAPPPYTLSNAMPDPNKINSKPLYAPPLTAFQVRQFDDLLKTVRSITASVLPNFSYSA
jgi:hypothetical protein